MSKALGFVGKVAGVVASVAMFIPGGQPIAAAAAAIAVVANVGAEITATKPPARGSVNGITIGSDNPTPYLIGRTYYGGTREYQRGYGPTLKKVPNPYLLMVDVYSGAGPVDGLETPYIDLQPLSAAGSYFDGHLFYQSQPGLVPQPAALSPQWAGAPGWTAASKLSGKAAIAWSLKFDKDGEVFASGAPQTGAVWRGVKAWDPRQDSTWPGGSGASRRDNPETWTWTRCPGLHGLKYALGTYHQGQKVFGIGNPIDGILVEDFVHLANVCDANGWHCDGVIFEPGSKWTNLKDILAAGGAEPVFVGGRLGVKVSAPRVALDTVSADDLTEDEIVVGSGVGWEERLNTLVPKYRSEAHQWEYVQAQQAVSIGSYVSVDGEEKKAERQFNLVQDATQASQLCALELFDRRELGDIEITVKPRLRRYGAGALVILDLPEAGLAALPCVIMKRTLDPATMTVRWVLRGETVEKYALALALTGQAPPIPALGTTQEYDQQSAGVAATARAAHPIIEGTQSLPYPVTSTADTVTVQAFEATIDTGERISFPATSFTGLSAATAYTVTRTLAAGTYAIAPSGSAAALAALADAANIIVRYVTTAAADGTFPAGPTAPGGDAGGGYGGGRYNNVQEQ